MSIKSSFNHIALGLVLLCSCSTIAQDKKPDTIFLYDTISYLIKPKFKVGGKENKFLVFSDSNLNGIMFKKVKYFGELPGSEPQEVRSYIWSKEFYKLANRKTPIPGFFKHFKDKSILYQVRDSIYVLEPRLYNID